MVVCSPIFVAETQIVFPYDFVALLGSIYSMKKSIRAVNFDIAFYKRKSATRKTFSDWFCFKIKWDGKTCCANAVNENKMVVLLPLWLVGEETLKYLSVSVRKSLM